MNKRQLTVTCVACFFIIVAAVNLFIFHGAPISKTLYYKLKPIVDNIMPLLQFFNIIFPVLVAAGLLVYLLRNKTPK